LIVPAPLVPGDHVRVISPSGPFDRALVLRGLGWLSSRYDVHFDSGLFARDGYLAGTDARRLAELNTALGDQNARAIFATRGGYGLARIAHAADVGALRDRPKWLVGFSDITALHVEAARVGVASLHAANIAGLGRDDAEGHTDFIRALEHPGELRRFADLKRVRSGNTVGIVTGGNLAVLFGCAAAGRLSLPDQSILLLEDIGEAPYRVDRMLSALLVSGALDRVAGVIVGDFVDAPAGKYGVDVEAVLEERLRELRVPVVSGFPVGHGKRNVPVHFGLNAQIDADAGTVSLGGPPS
jgi:muramoyltetrapeptide carboxypeptidase